MIRIVYAQKLNGVISITVERRHWYWPWLRRREYIANDRLHRMTLCTFDGWTAGNYDSYVWREPTTGAYVGDSLAVALTGALTDFEQREQLLHCLEQGYDNVISLEEKKRKGA